MTAIDWLAFLDEVADGADELAMRWFRDRDLRIEEKSDSSPVTEADRAIESAARALARERHPGLGILGEEEGEKSGAGSSRMIIDPIDGTRNYVRGIPVFATLLAIEEAGEIVAGVVSAPALRARWRAARGLGAFEGERRIEVSRISSLERASLFQSSAGPGEGGAPSRHCVLAARVERTRDFGDFWQHVLVAGGCGEIAIDAVVQPWDIAPLQVLVEEAGGRATSLSGERSIRAGSLLTTNGALHQAVLDVLSPGERDPTSG